MNYLCLIAIFILWYIYMNMIYDCGMHAIVFLALSLLKHDIINAFWNIFAEYLHFQITIIITSSHVL